MKPTTNSISARIAKGKFTPHTGLTRMALAYFQNASNYFAKSIFPICKVDLSSDNYYVFDKEDLLKDGWSRKPAYGKVNPVVLSEHTENYSVVVDQMIMGIDTIRQTDLQRRQAPGIADPRRQRTKAIAEQANIHQDILFAKNFFKSGVWSSEWTGVEDTAISGNQFIKFDNDNSDPIKFIQGRKRAMQRKTGRMPNKLALGCDVFDALTQHPAILERVVYGGTTANPADVTVNVLAQLFGVKEVKVLQSIHNKAEMGADADMDFIADSTSMLLAYATDAPSVEEPSAGYIFTWDMLGDGQILPIFHYDGEDGVHAEYIEGLMASAQKQTAPDLAEFFTNVVGPVENATNPV